MPISKWMKLDRKARCDPVIARKDFWSSMPSYLKARNYLTMLESLNLYILSAYVEHANDPNCIHKVAQMGLREILEYQ